MLAQHQYTHLLLKAATKEPPHPETDGLHLEMLRALSKQSFPYLSTQGEHSLQIHLPLYVLTQDIHTETRTENCIFPPDAVS